MKYLFLLLMLSGCQYQPVAFENGNVSTPPQGCIDARERGVKC